MLYSVTEPSIKLGDDPFRVKVKGQPDSRTMLPVSWATNVEETQHGHVDIRFKDEDGCAANWCVRTREPCPRSVGAMRCKPAHLHCKVCKANTQSRGDLLVWVCQIVDWSWAVREWWYLGICDNNHQGCRSLRITQVCGQGLRGARM